LRAPVMVCTAASMPAVTGIQLPFSEIPPDRSDHAWAALIGRLPMASSSRDRTVDLGSFGPVGRSTTELRRRHFATVF
jgi:hypothetical protein